MIQTKQGQTRKVNFTRDQLNDGYKIAILKFIKRIRKRNIQLQNDLLGL